MNESMSSGVARINSVVVGSGEAPEISANPDPLADRLNGRTRTNGKATIYDIAKLAGVNASTVSRALSKPDRVSSKTRKLVEDTAANLNYHANPFARALPTGRTGTLGLIVADITNPTFFDIIRGAGTAAAANNYTVTFAESAESPATELTTARRMLAAVDGLILGSPRMDDEQIRTLANIKPVVVINREVRGVTSVVPDVSTGIGEAVRNLAANGHQRLSYVSGPPESWMSSQRWESIRSACEWSRLEAVHLPSTKPTVDGGRRLARELLASGATAVLTYNDLLAIGLMQELQAAGVLIPDQISIVGFDDIFGADFTTPPLTTVRSPLSDCGTKAAELMLEAITSDAGVSSVHVETELVVRGSSGRLMPP